MPGRRKLRSAESYPNDKVHPAAIFVALFMGVAVGRLPEIFGFLQPIHFGKVTLAAAVVSVLMSKAETNSLLTSAIARRVLIFCLVAILSLSYSIWGSRTLEFVVNDLLRIVLLFGLIYKTCINEATFRFYVLSFSLVLALMSTIGLLAVSAARTSFSQNYDPNDIGLVVLTISAFLFGVAKDKTTRNRIPILVLSLAGFSVVLSTQSRGGFLGLCAVAMYFLLANTDVSGNRFYRFPSIRVIAGFLVGIVVIILLTPAESWDRILTIFELESDYNTSSDDGRLAIWGRGMDAFFRRPWGVGAGAYQAADMVEGGRYVTAHNSFLQVAVELGLIGFLTFLSFYRRVWSTSAYLLRQKRAGIALGFRAALVGFSVSGFFLSMAYGRVFYTLLALVAAAETLWGESSTETDQSASGADRSKHE